MNQKTSEYKLLSGLFFRLLPFQILMVVISAINGIVDSLYASNAIGTTAMSAIGLYGPLNHFLYAASIMFVGGSQILYGRFLTVDRKHINGLFTINIITSLGLSVVSSIILVICVFTNATTLFVSEPDSLAMLNSYILGQVAGIPALIVGQQLFAFLSLENQTKLTTTASIICFIFNAILNHIFVVILHMGTFGLGLSTSISSWGFLLVMAMYYITGKSEWRFSLKSIDMGDIARIISLGYPGAISRFLEMFRCFIVNFLILTYVGTDGISAFAAVNSLLAIVWAVPFGMIAVARMLFSISVGEQDRRSLVNIMKIIFTKCMLIMVVIVIALVVFAVPLTRLFYQDPSLDVYHMTVMGFRILPLCMPLSIISGHYSVYAQTIEKKKMSVLLPIIDGMVGVVLFSFLLIPSIGLNGLYVANILNGCLCFLLVSIGAAIVLRRLPKNLEDFMAMPQGFGASDDERIDVSVKSMDEVLTVSEQIVDFCKKNGIDKKKAFYAGLCMEEMAGNIVTHGFAQDNKNHSVDIRVISKDEKLILRMRDNCSEFDPSKRAEVMESTEDGKNIGIKLVYKIAREVEYQNLLGLNVLTIQI
ncbi:Na+-driven multidrug efflux pump [Lachnospiraceae bacterium NE2001]|nr:Na+-driven multidrug efflux pump [Lachnospiraceae bacterium NE2001]